MTALPSRVLDYTTNLTTQGSCCARGGLMELADNALAGCQVRPMTVEIGYGSCFHDYAINDGKKGQPR